MRITLRRVLLVIPALLVAACAEHPSAPEASVAAEASPFMKVFSTYSEDRRSADIIVEPSGGVFTLGAHAVYFPAGSICDPELSSYGVTEWDKPCTAIASPIEIHAELREQDGRSWIEFSPDIRFVPSDDPEQWVHLFMRTTAVEAKKLTSKDAPPIYWSPAIGVVGIDESLEDATMKTKWDKRLGGVYRRIKHFSIYNVFCGRTEEALPLQ